MDPFIEIGPFEVDRAQMERYREGALIDEWLQLYEPRLPLFFGAHGRWFYDHQGRRTENFGGGYGFFESLGRIILQQATGWQVLSPTWNFVFDPTDEQLAAGKRDREEEKQKKAVVEKLFTAEELTVLRDQDEGRTQAPDLLVYAPDLSDYFFCEVKGQALAGKHDQLGAKQQEKFERLAALTGKPIRLLKFRWLPA